MKNQAHPIIVVKRRKAKSHGAAWIVKIAYADFYEIDDGLFLVMWLIISSPKELIQIAEYWTPLAICSCGRRSHLPVKAHLLAVVMITPKARGK